MSSTVPKNQNPNDLVTVRPGAFPGDGPQPGADNYKEWLAANGLPYDPRSWDKGMVWLQQNRPWYAFFLQNAKRLLDAPGCDTAYVTVRGGDVILGLNTYFGSCLRTEECGFILMHEVGHLVNEHLYRFRGERYTGTPEARTAIVYAAEWAVNGPIQNLIPKGMLYDNTCTPHNYVYEGGLLPADKSVDWYFDLLMEHFEQQGQKPEAGDCNDQHVEADGEAEMDVEAVKEAVRRAAKNATAKLKQATQGQGDTPAELVAGLIELSRDSQVPFGRLFRNRIGALLSTTSKSSILRLSRRRDAPPGRTRERKLKVLVAQDDSGSVPERARELLRAEAVALHRSGLAEVWFQRFCMERVGPLVQITDGNMGKIAEQYSGGTDFEDMVRLSREIQADILILATDGEAPTPTKPRCPLVWVLSPGGHRHAIGTTIELTDRQLKT